MEIKRCFWKNIIQNYFFDKKQDMYKKSVLPINEYLKTIKQFSREEVEIRQSEFGKIADKIWNVESN